MMESGSGVRVAGNDLNYFFCHSRDIPDPLTLRISSLEGPCPALKASQLFKDPALRHTGTASTPAGELPELVVTAQVYCDGIPLTIVEQTLSKSFKSKWIWNEWIEFPIKYQDLPLNAVVALTLWDSGGSAGKITLGGTTLPLFSQKGTLKRGRKRCLVHHGVQADVSRPSKTPAKSAQRSKMDHLEKVSLRANVQVGYGRPTDRGQIMKKYERGDIEQIPWLDQLTFRQVEKVHVETLENSLDQYLYIDLPRFGLPVIFSEKRYTMPSLPEIPAAIAGPSSVSHAISPMSWYNQSMSVPDPEMARDNLVEAKLRKMVRSQRTTALDREMKPNAKLRDEINAILRLPPIEALSSDDKNTLWKFRFYLSRDKKALTKFLRAVTWTDPVEVKQATDLLLPLWATVDVEDALELLGPSFDNQQVRQYAVNCLKHADDEDLILYLLQLVQALKFESFVEQTNPRKRLPIEENSLVTFLIERSINDEVLGNSFYWYIAVECEDKTYGRLYQDILTTYLNRLESSSNGDYRMNILIRQKELVGTLTKLAKEIRTSRDARPAKVEKLKTFISDAAHRLDHFEVVSLPLDAKIKVNGIISQQSNVFKSNLFPLQLHFTCEKRGVKVVDDSVNSSLPAGTSVENYPIIFKDGDDLRQDQLVIQLISLMDRLLRKENLDLRLSPYRVLATGPLQGMVQFVPSTTLQAILSEHNNSILPYLRLHNAEEGATGTFGIKPLILDNFVRSCAGYCVITYILGVGDRHMDNLLIAPDGHFFHVDFGYILGRDPKPFPPPVKICKEMIEAMGGSQSVHYIRFRSYCYTAFSTLRKQSNLILNLLSLMVKANVPDIRSEPDKVVPKVREKFRLDLSEEEAIQYFQTMMDNTLSGFAVVFMDRVHSLAQYWRS